ncbi:hypothetical protein PFLUV_G00150980 [Perca fluviatilis]|uniref:Uncharacterized protein n=1 Tax=Perca fluviatilis TaxID=8168 RepID=A0A6A5EJT1_PERFL|nr:hypothetical protein PFLUV_G00150980 [Perca fluviatilis]
MENIKKTLGQGVTVLGPQSTDSSTLWQSLTDDDTLGAGAQPSEDSNVSTEHGPRPDEELTVVGPQATDSSTLGDTLGAGILCGSHCARLTSAGSIEAKMSCWSFDLHRDQEQVLRYVLDPKRQGHELSAQQQYLPDPFRLLHTWPASADGVNHWECLL